MKSYGDEIMASGQAYVEHVRTGKQITICDRIRHPRWCEMWQGLDWITGPDDPTGLKMINGPQARPYIRYPFTRKIGQSWSGWRARDHVGKIKFTDAEIEFAKDHAPDRDFVIIEPNTADIGNPNKQWGQDRWQTFVDLCNAMLPDIHFVQMMAPDQSWFFKEGAQLIATPTFRQAAALLSLARAAVLPEGGLHHAAGALEIPAVVLFSGVVPPEITGYPIHTNFAAEKACGTWSGICSHCQEWWRMLDPLSVKSALSSILESGSPFQNKES